MNVPACSRCGSWLVEWVDDELHCLYCGHVRYLSEPLPYHENEPRVLFKIKASVPPFRIINKRGGEPTLTV